MKRKEISIGEVKWRRRGKRACAILIIGHGCGASGELVRADSQPDHTWGKHMEEKVLHYSLLSILAHTYQPEIAYPTLVFLGLSLFSHKILRLGNKKYNFFEEKER
jgi:hypothetical protein